MPRIAAALCAACLSLAPLSVVGHPHVFIETGLSLEIDAQGQLAAIHTVFVLDEITSFNAIEAQELDADGDGTPEQAALSRWARETLDWSLFAEALEPRIAQTRPSLGAPMDPRASYHGGMIVLEARWDLAEPVGLSGSPLALKIYDQSFYVAFNLVEPVTLSAEAPCTWHIEQADLKEAQRVLEELFDAMPAEAILENDFPEVGGYYADTLRVACTSGS